MNSTGYFKGKKVLVVVLGAYGGGAAAAKWFLKQGARVTVTDFRPAKELARSLRMFTPAEKRRIRFVLGGQREEDFKNADLIIAGPGVPNDSIFLKAAKEAGVPVENEASIFFRFNRRPVIAVTGTRGKTTTAMWIAYLLSGKYPRVKVAGNAQVGARGGNPLLAELNRVSGGETPVVAELSSWQLERLPLAKRGPAVAVITNIFPDHLDRYGGSMKQYARAKANIFRYQTKNDFLVLNKRSPWTKFFLAQKPKSQVSFFSSAEVPGSFKRKWGEHNAENLAAALLAVKLYDPSLKITKKLSTALPAIPFRQEVIYDAGGIVVVNDSTATSPDAASVALRRFSPCVLIAGGTNKELDFRNLAKDMRRFLPPERLILINGSATERLVAELSRIRYWKKGENPLICETLGKCLRKALAALPLHRGTVVFSPGAASFEKFKNEFDRGEKFAKAAKRILA